MKCQILSGKEAAKSQAKELDVGREEIEETKGTLLKKEREC